MAFSDAGKRRRGAEQEQRKTLCGNRHAIDATGTNESHRNSSAVGNRMVAGGKTETMARYLPGSLSSHLESPRNLVRTGARLCAGESPQSLAGCIGQQR